MKGHLDLRLEGGVGGSVFGIVAGSDWEVVEMARGIWLWTEGHSLAQDLVGGSPRNAEGSTCCVLFAYPGLRRCAPDPGLTDFGPSGLRRGGLAVRGNDSRGFFEAV